MRFEKGEKEPEGECPDCGALCHRIEQKEDEKPDLLQTAQALSMATSTPAANSAASCPSPSGAHSPKRLMPGTAVRSKRPL